MTTFLQFVANGIALGGLYALVGVGVTLIYGLTRLINFAHGEQVTLGGFGVYIGVAAGWPFGLAVLGGGFAAATAGWVMERVAFRHTRERPINGIILSIGIAIVFQSIYFLIWGDTVASIGLPIAGVWDILGVRLTQQRVLVTAVAGVLVALLFAGLRFTRWGRAIRAYAQDAEAAELMGVPTERVVSLVFVVGGLLAGLAGGLLLSLVPISRFVGATFAVKGFLVAIVGGLGNPTGALLAGILIGLAESLTGAYVSGGLAAVAGLIAAVAILMVRPRGIMRGEEGAEL